VWGGVGWGGEGEGGDGIDGFFKKFLDWWVVTSVVHTTNLFFYNCPVSIWNSVLVVLWCHRMVVLLHDHTSLCWIPHLQGKVRRVFQESCRPNESYNTLFMCNFNTIMLVTLEITHPKHCVYHDVFLTFLFFNVVSWFSWDFLCCF
jgi:hypothetical protein